MSGERCKRALALSLALIAHLALLTDRWVMKGWRSEGAPVRAFFLTHITFITFITYITLTKKR